MTSSRLWWAVSLLCSLLFGVAIGLQVAPAGDVDVDASTPKPPSERTPRRSHQPQANTPVGNAGGMDTDVVASCQDDLRKLQADYDAFRAIDAIAWTAAVGKAVEFCDAIPYEYTAAGVLDLMDEVVASCPSLLPGRWVLDCDEFPCLLLAEGQVNPKKCQAWDLDLAGGQYTRTPDGTISLFTLRPMPLPAGFDPVNLGIRLEYRQNAFQRATTAEWE